MRTTPTARGNHLAGGVTYFGFLSFFPLLAVSFAVLGWVVVVYPEARTEVERVLTENLPGLVGSGTDKIDIDTIAGAKAGAGILGLAGLLYAGLGWLDALREAMRQLYGLEPSQTNIVVRKLTDVVLLGLIGTGALATIAASSLATSLTRQVLGLVDLAESTAAAALLKVLALALSVAADTLLLTIIFARLPGHRLPWRDVVSGAFLGAVLLGVLKLIGTWLVAQTTDNPVYGAFAVIVGLLVWMNFLCRAVLLSASWAVTGAKPVVSPAATTDPLVRIPVLDAADVTDAPVRGRGRLAVAGAVAALLAVRRRGG
jgi:membrane protein